MPGRDLRQVVLLATLCALPPLSIDMGLPSLPAAGGALGVSTAGAGLTLTVFMAGFALSPIVYGTLSDRWGRRPLLIAGLSLFATGGVACVLAPTLGWLLLARLLQGAGAGCGPTLAFAATRDRLTGRALGQRIAVLTMLLNTAPVIAPSLGAVCLGLGGWRGVYVVLAACGFLSLLVACSGFTESHSPAGAGRSGLLARLCSDAATLRQRPEVLFPGLVYGLSAGSMFAYVSSSPLLLIQGLGASPTLYAGLFALTGAGIAAGAFLSGRALRTMAPIRLVTSGLALTLAGPIGAAVMLETGMQEIAPIFGCMVIGTFGYGLIAPAAAHATLDPVPDMAGTASAMMNSFQMTCMAMSSLLVSLLWQELGLFASSTIMVGFALVSAGCGYCWRAKPSPRRAI